MPTRYRPAPSGPDGPFHADLESAKIKMEERRILLSYIHPHQPTKPHLQTYPPTDPLTKPQEDCTRPHFRQTGIGGGGGLAAQGGANDIGLCHTALQMKHPTHSPLFPLTHLPAPTPSATQPPPLCLQQSTYPPFLISPQPLTFDHSHTIIHLHH